MPNIIIRRGTLPVCAEEGRGNQLPTKGPCGGTNCVDTEPIETANKPLLHVGGKPSYIWQS